MKTISVTVDDDTHRRLRTMAVEQGTSVSALVREQMLRVLNGSTQEDSQDTEPESLRRWLDEFQEKLLREGIKFSASERLTREEMYQRGAPR